MSPVETLLTLAVGAALAGLGVLVRGRLPRGVVEWNEAFLAGGGLAATLLFVLSLLVGPGALSLLMALVPAAGVTAFAVVRREAAPAPRPECARPGPDEVVLGALIALSFAAFAVANARYNLLWDGLYIWATKAMLLVDADALAPELWPGAELDGRVGRVAGYPNLVPLLEAAVSSLRGSFDFDAAKPVFLLFFASLLAGTWGAARRLGGTRAGLVAAAAVAALPPLSTRWAAGGYADMPQAAALAGLAGALLRGPDEGPSWRRPAPWLFGAVVAVKSEGTVLALVALGGWALGALLAKGARGAAEAARRNAGGLLVVAAFLAQRIAYSRWTAAPYDDHFLPLGPESFRVALGRVPEVARLVLGEMADVSKWGLLWPALAAGAAMLLARGNAPRRALALSTVAATGLYAAIFLFTSWPVARHIATALDRILSQLAPAAAVVVAAALTSADGEAAPRREEAPEAPPGV